MRARTTVLAVCLLAGCDQVFDLHRPPVPPDAAIDARMLDPGCSGMGMFADDFESGLSPLLWTERYTTNPSLITITAVAGTAQVTLGTEGYASLAAGRYFDLRDSSFSIEVSGPLSANGEVRLVLRAQDRVNPQTTTALEISRLGARLKLRRTVNDSVFEMLDIPYDPDAHRFWRIARTGDDVTWETSSDGQTFVERTRFAGLDWVTFMAPELLVQRPANDPAFTITFDNVNGGTPSGTACAAFGLSDDFEDGVIGEIWARRVGTPRTVETGGQLQMTVPAGGYEAELMVASTIYDLRDGAFFLEIPQPIALVPNFDARFEVNTLDGWTLQTVVRGGMLTCNKSDMSGSIEVGSEPYDAIAHRWWRIRGEGGNVLWETSADGTTYHVVGTNNVTGLDRVDVGFSITGSPPTEVVVSFDNFNVAPP